MGVIGRSTRPDQKKGVRAYRSLAAPISAENVEICLAGDRCPPPYPAIVLAERVKCRVSSLAFASPFGLEGVHRNREPANAHRGTYAARL